MSKLICLDAGHGGKDPGAIGFGRQEKDDTLRMILVVDKLLQKQGVKTHLTRSKDEYVELYSRPKTSNSVKADVFVSIHRNAVASQGANGSEIWVHPQAPYTDTMLATEIHERLVDVGVQSNRGVKKGSYVVLTANAPAVLLELGFITNKVDNELFDANFNAYAVAIAKGICAYVGVPYKEDSGETEKPALYRVQVGAFSNEDNAVKLMNDIQAMGYDAYLVRPSSEKVEPA